ncbi:MAG: hypothetical protein NTY88_08930 [Bacteroidetes bacterium]|nr:hypothetical protein [Bacteroidota bacterium]
MKFLKINFALLSFSILLSFSACKKKCTEAGTGGQVTLVASPKHHVMAIVSGALYPDTVFLKFNTKDNPGANLTSYDTYFVGEPGEEHVHMEGLKCGDYYIYAVGYDSTISKRVMGGIPYSFEKESGEIDLNIPVTE